jgi:NAD-dependent SIR2 family protein deacetylase
MDDAIQKANDAIRTADALVIAAGAGMGVDSGLPDFRGTQGFWRAYPRYEKLGLDFMSVANPEWFHRDPTMAWGFYGHRLNLYRAAVPHEGFAILRRWAGRLKHGAFVFTSNVDGHFQKAGFDTNDQLRRRHLSHAGFAGGDQRRDDAGQRTVAALSEVGQTCSGRLMLITEPVHKSLSQNSTQETG